MFFYSMHRTFHFIKQIFSFPARGFFFAFVIITVCFSSATIPLYAELTCEVTFAAHEAAVQSLHGLGMAVVWALAFSYIPLSECIWRGK